jgi:signal transduction histidine kinase
MELFLESRHEDLKTIREISLISLLPLTILSFAGGYVIADQMLRPLKRLNTTIEEITAENLSNRIPYEDTGDEISELIRNFNSMISRLDRTFENQRQFVENASHELKTPLAIIQTNLESALVSKSLTKKEVTGLIKTANSSSKFMDKLIEDLLLLSTLDQDIKKTKINVASILGMSAKNLRPIAKDQSITIKTDIPSKSMKSKGNSVLLQRAFMNVIENAIKYSPKKSTVKISAKKSGGNIVISVSDSGSGIPKKHRKKIFERFYRVDKSRSRKTGGTGLGLAITKEIIELHDGTIIVASDGKKGSRFKIVLPQA